MKAKAMEYGFDNIFTGGPTPTPSAVAFSNRQGNGDKENIDETDEMDDLDDMGDMDDIDDINDDDDVGNVDGMDI